MEYNGKQAADDFLKHYGVLGMKWGVHRSRGKNTTQSKSPAKKTRKLSRGEQALLNEKANQDKSPAKKTRKLSRGEQALLNEKANQDKRPSAKSSNKSKKTVQISADANKARITKNKKLSEMSNAELKALNNRLQMERQYKQLTAENKNKGMQYVSSIVSNAGKQVATKWVAKYMDDAVKAALSR